MRDEFSTRAKTQAVLRIRSEDTCTWREPGALAVHSPASDRYEAARIRCAAPIRPNCTKSRAET